ncbi:MAG: hypothetical protein F6J90_27850 [Moorea sp. SIOASIH]|nr:hypothetical protein [Moorena sp. SIOASIH]NEO39942.1 hypothetical protein [Moorena sp. SIOASIH]
MSFQSGKPVSTQLSACRVSAISLGRWPRYGNGYVTGTVYALHPRYLAFE